MSTIGNRIRQRRLAADMTLKELADKIGVTEATAQRYESGAIKNLKHETIYKIANALSCAPDYLTGWTDDLLNSTRKIQIKENYMNELQIFQNEDFGEVRTIDRDGQPWFVAIDVCKALDIEDTGKATSRLDEDELTRIKIGSGGQNREMIIINEPGLYALVLGSRKPEARAFKRWITHDVIPSIRKHGVYAIDEMLDNPDAMIAALSALKEERAQRKALEDTCAVQSQQIAELQPKASYYDVVLNCKDLISVTKIAKDYGKSAQWLNEKLREMGIQFKQGDIWLLYQKYAKEGYTSTKTHDYPGNDGKMHARVQTYWTPKGRLFIYDLLKADNILPLIEREIA